MTMARPKGTPEVVQLQLPNQVWKLGLLAAAPPCLSQQAVWWP